MSSAAKPANAVKTSLAVPAEPAGSRGRIYLIDAMSFIFRAYHAMARQRPMSTKTGIPTSATFVFVNMLRKLRADFAPPYLAAVFDVSAPTFRDEQAAAIVSTRKFDSKTQTFVDKAYDGYKANRAAMPDDLAQQVPYIRRALEAYRIPILEVPGFEADDVIGTLAHKAADAGYSVFVVSSDKDMMQLVDERICVLNPPKDNLICDAAKVEEILGVPPDKVVDVMALRGDSIDNIPGAPGIGDKGSVELIQRFGSVEAALDHATEVERKTYRESLQNNRNAILISKQLVTIDTNVAVEFEPEKMRAQEPDAAAARSLFTELEFNTLVQDFLSESIELGETDYREANSADEVKAVIAAARKPGAMLAIALDSSSAAGAATQGIEEPEEAESDQLSLGAAPQPAVPASTCRVAISASDGNALSLALDDQKIAAPLKQALSDSSITKAVHDSKSVMHAMREQGIELAGVEHDPLLYAYLLDPTYSTYALGVVAFRKFNLKLGPSPAEAADVTLRLAHKLREEVERAGLRKVYDEIDLPLVPVLARMEEAGVKLDCDVLATMSHKLASDIDAKAREIYAKADFEFNINSPKQLGDVLFNRLNLPKPVKYGKGKTISTAVDVLEGLAAEHEIPRMVLDYRQLSKLKSTYVDALPALLNSCTKRLHTTFNMAGSATGRLSSVNPNLQNIPDPHRAGPRNPCGVRRRARECSAEGRLLADRVASARAFFRRQAAGRGLWYRPGHPHAHRVAGLRRAAADGRRRTSPPRQSRELRHRLRALAVRTVAATRHRHQRSQALHRRLLREVQRRARVHRPHAGRRRAAIRKSQRSSAACAPFPTFTARTSTCADSPSAPPSTRRCKAPPPTLSRSQ